MTLVVEEKGEKKGRRRLILLEAPSKLTKSCETRGTNVSQSASQPVSQSASQPVSQSASQPVSQSASQPVSQSASSQLTISHLLWLICFAPTVLFLPSSALASSPPPVHLEYIFDVGPDTSDDSGVLTIVARYDYDLLLEHFERSDILSLEVGFRSGTVDLPTKTLRVLLDPAKASVIVGQLPFSVLTTDFGVVASSAAVELDGERKTVLKQPLLLGRGSEGPVIMDYSDLVQQQLRAREDFTSPHAPLENLEPGEAPDESTRPQGEPTDMCGITVNCLGE